MKQSLKKVILFLFLFYGISFGLENTSSQFDSVNLINKWSYSTLGVVVGFLNCGSIDLNNHPKEYTPSEKVQQFNTCVRKSFQCCCQTAAPCTFISLALATTACATSTPAACFLPLVNCTMFTPFLCMNCNNCCYNYCQSNEYFKKGHTWSRSFYEFDENYIPDWCAPCFYFCNLI